MRQLRYLNAVLTVVAVLLTMNLWVAWQTTPGGERLTMTQSANAQGLVDAGSQRREMIDLLKQLNVSMSELQGTLTDGTMRLGSNADSE